MKKIFTMLLFFILIFSVSLSPRLAAENNAPELEKGVLLYTFKNHVFSYKFQVEYIDADGDAPRYVFVFINGSKREMYKVDTKDNNAKDGILYMLSIDQDELFRLAPKAQEWEITYWFRTNDGKGPVSTKTSKLFALDTESMGLITANSAGGSIGGGSSSGCGCGK